ncbi:MAG TPA: dioxygenase [Chloroflexia bacterium]|nr:dioxygenase [Chloroflexia bacterium]
MKKHVRRAVSRRKFIQLAAVISPALALAACGEQATISSTSQAQAQPTTATSSGTPTTTVAATASPTTPVATTQPASTTQAAATTAAAATIQITTQVAAKALPPTPACTSKASQTMAETEGPYFKPSSPERKSLWEAGTTGTRLIVTGYVLSTDCQPVKNALLDFWQADANGQYDNTGYRLRGHQFTDENGVFRLETVIPGLYPGRTRHIHVKVQAPNQPILTTQLYFPGEARNQTDSLYNKELLMEMTNNADGNKQGGFNFVLKLT